MFNEVLKLSGFSLATSARAFNFGEQNQGLKQHAAAIDHPINDVLYKPCVTSASANPSRSELFCGASTSFRAHRKASFALAVFFDLVPVP